MSIDATALALGQADHLATDAAGSGSESLVSLRTILDPVRRRWVVWTTLALLGLMGGYAFHYAVPRPAQAKTTLYLVYPTGTSPDLSMATDLSLLKTRTVASMAVSRLGLQMSPDDFLKTYSAVSPSQQVMTITSSAPDSTDALQRTVAVSAAFLQFRTQQMTAQARTAIQALQEQLDATNRSITQATSAINSMSARGANSDSSQLQDLLAQRAAETSQASQLQAKIQDDQLSVDEVVRGSSVIDTARVVPASSGRLDLIDGGSGLVIGLALGLGLVSLQAITSDRVRRRHDVALALGSPVTASTGRIRLPRLLGRRRAMRMVTRPQGSLRTLARHIAQAAAPGSHKGPSALIVVAVDCEETAAAATAAAAVSLCGAGRRVLVADLSSGGRLARLFRLHRPGRKEVALSGLPGARNASGTITVTATSAEDRHVLDDGGSAGPTSTGPEGADTVIVMATLDPGSGAHFLRRWSDRAVVVVTAGRSSAPKITGTSHMLEEAGVTVQAALLIGADSRDETLGTAGSAHPDRDLMNAGTHAGRNGAAEHGNGKPPATHGKGEASTMKESIHVQDRMYLYGEPQLVRFLDAEPATGQHDGSTVVFDVIHMNADDGPTLRELVLDDAATKALSGAAKKSKAAKGHLDRTYWEIARVDKTSKKGKEREIPHFSVVKERDLEEEWAGVAPLTKKQIRRFQKAHEAGKAAVPPNRESANGHHGKNGKNGKSGESTDATSYWADHPVL